MLSPTLRNFLRRFSTMSQSLKHVMVSPEVGLSVPTKELGTATLGHCKSFTNANLLQFNTRAGKMPKWAESLVLYLSVLTSIIQSHTASMNPLREVPSQSPSYSRVVEIPTVVYDPTPVVAHPGESGTRCRQEAPRWFTSGVLAHTCMQLLNLVSFNHFPAVSISIVVFEIHRSLTYQLDGTLPVFSFLPVLVLSLSI